MSKKSVVFLVILILYLLLTSSCAHIHKGVWKRTVLLDPEQPWSEIHEAKRGNTDCIVGLKRDGTGVRIGAIEFTPGKIFLQTLETTLKPAYFNVQNTILEKEDGYVRIGNRFVYREKCLEITPQLPDEVRKKFHGSMGVK